MKIPPLTHHPQLPTGGTEREDVVHEPDVEQPCPLHPIIQLLVEERPDEPYAKFKTSFLVVEK